MVSIMNTIILICAECKTEFNKFKGEYNRRIRNGATEFFCSLSCYGKDAIVKRPFPPPDPEFIKSFAGNRKDDLSSFRYFHARARFRKNKGETNLTPEYLKEVWDSQKGICPLSGLEMILPEDTGGWIKGKQPNNASMDRIDNNNGYIKGNVRFITVMANLARADFSDKEVIEFCQAVCNNAIKFGPPLASISGES